MSFLLHPNKMVHDKKCQKELSKILLDVHDGFLPQNKPTHACFKGNNNDNNVIKLCFLIHISDKIPFHGRCLKRTCDVQNDFYTRD